MVTVQVKIAEWDYALSCSQNAEFLCSVIGNCFVFSVVVVICFLGGFICLFVLIGSDSVAQADLELFVQPRLVSPMMALPLPLFDKR